MLRSPYPPIREELGQDMLLSCRFMKLNRYTPGDFSAFGEECE